MTDQSIKLQQLEEEKNKNRRDYEVKREDNARKRDEHNWRKIHDTGKLVFDSASKISGAAIGALSANDPSWYNQVPELSELASKVSFSIPSGLTLPDFDWCIAPNGERETLSFSGAGNPGIMTFDFYPSIGIQDEEHINPIMAAGQNIFSRIREAISPALPYEAMDVVKLAILLDSAASIASYAARTYSFMGETTHTNKYEVFGYLKASMPDATDEGLDEFIQQANDFRLAINKFMQNISHVKIPNEFRVITRHSWMSANIFADSPEHNSSVYMFKPAVYYVYNQLRGSLDAVPLTGADALTSLTRWKKVFNAIINTFYNFSDISRISGDCVKTFGLENCYSFSGLSVSPTLSVSPIYSLEVLSQICNASVGESVAEAAGANTPASACIWEKNSEITSNNFYSGRLYQSIYPGNQDRVELGIVTKAAGPYSHYLRLYTDKATPDDIMVATRLMYALGSKVVGTVSNIPVRAIPICGSEVLMDARFYSFSGVDKKYPIGTFLGGDFTKLLQFDPGDWVDPNSGFQKLQIMMESLVIHNAFLQAFEWAPLLRHRITIRDEADTSKLDFAGRGYYDMHFVAHVSNEAMSNMHYAAIVSEYAGVSMLKTSGRKTRK